MAKKRNVKQNKGSTQTKKITNEELHELAKVGVEPNEKPLTEQEKEIIRLTNLGKVTKR